jgi:caffeoyl-CoA O-methyltransferase
LQPPPSTLLASEFVYEELQDLQRTVEKGVSMLGQQTDQQRLQLLRQVLERSKSEIRDLLVGSSVPKSTNTGSHDAPVDPRELEEAIAQVFVSEDEVLRQTLVRAREHGLPSIQISALQGKLLQVLATACQARKILEIGALAGYSGIWLARALPANGRLITLEVDATHAEVVRESFRQAQVDDRAEVRVGPALETLPHLVAEGPFDLIFIDADKDPYPQYLAWAIQLARPGSIIVADNCIWGGSGLRVQDTPNTRDAGIRAYNRHASSDPALCSIALPINTGMTISVVLDRPEQQEA